jgi:hypothetical protein
MTKSSLHMRIQMSFNIKCITPNHPCIKSFWVSTKIAWLMKLNNMQLTIHYFSLKLLQKFATSKKPTTPGKRQPVLLLTTPSPKQAFTKKLRIIAGSVINKDINQGGAIHVLKTHTRNWVQRSR